VFGSALAPCLSACSPSRARPGSDSVPLTASRSVPACRDLMAILPRVMNGDARASTAGSNPAVYGDRRERVWCGVARPAEFSSASLLFEIAGSFGSPVVWVSSSDAQRFTAVDRSVFVAIDVPKGVTPELATLSATISTVLPAVCTHVVARQPGSQLPLCSNR